ncbi:MAG: BatA and WFA domain-containing protein [Sedimentisphaerales bacterium]|nr:BatA and WFA domain-containing protein [Sedimentisphaerales bacterium]
MIFSAPFFLYLLPAAGLPVLFHLFLKQKKRQILFPTLMFFYRTDPRLNSRRKIHQWLLLLMRVLLIAFILLALSRPSFKSTAPLGGTLSVVAIVDNSGSMSETAGGDKTKLELAVGGVRKLISALGDSAKITIVTLVDDPSANFGDTLTSDRDTLLSVLDELAPTAATGDADRALAKAFRILQADSGAGGVVHVFSDLQESEWSDDDLRTESADDTISVVFHRIESQTRGKPNVAISSIQYPRQKILPKHTAKVGVVCRNNSEGTATIRLNSIDNQDNKKTQNVVLESGGSQVIEVETNPDAAGHHWIKAWVEGDGFSADNEAGIGILCQQTATVFFAGLRSQFGILPTALSPDDYGQITGMVSQYGRIDRLLQANGEKPILVVATWQEMGKLSQDSKLEEYVNGGGNLLIVPPSTGIDARGNTPAWIGAQMKDRVFNPRGTNLDLLDKNADFWNRIRQTIETIPMDNVHVFTFYPLQLSEDFTPLLGTDFENVILAHRELGGGNLFVCGTAFDPRWNTLPLTGMMVVMAQNMATDGESFEQEAMLNLVAGEPLKGIEAAGRQVEVLPLVGEPIEWEGRAGELPVFTKPGVYQVNVGDKEYCISVRSSEKEGLTQFVEGSQIPVLEKITHTVVDYSPADELEKYHYGHSRTFELFLPLLLLATLALLAEGWLANPVRAKSEESVSLEGTQGDQSEQRILIGRGVG